MSKQRPGRVELARQGGLPLGDPPGPLLPRPTSTPRRRSPRCRSPRCSPTSPPIPARSRPTNAPRNFVNGASGRSSAGSGDDVARRAASEATIGGPEEMSELPTWSDQLRGTGGGRGRPAGRAGVQRSPPRPKSRTWSSTCWRRLPPAISAASIPTLAGRCSCRCGTTPPPGRPQPRLCVLDDRDRSRWGLPDIGNPRNDPLRRDHPAGREHPEPLPGASEGAALCG